MVFLVGKKTWQPEFKSGMGLFAFHIVLILVGKGCIQSILPSYLFVVKQTGLFKPRYSNRSRRRKTEFKPVKPRFKNELPDTSYDEIFSFVKEKNDVFFMFISTVFLFSYLISLKKIYFGIFSNLSFIKILTAKLKFIQVWIIFFIWHWRIIKL